MIKKTDLVKQYIKKGDWKSALKIASRFRILSKQDKKDLVRAHESIHNPQLYQQMGFNPSELQDRGINVLNRLWG